MSYRASIIRSIERGTITLGSGESTKTVTLSTPVDPATSYVCHLGNTVSTLTAASLGNGACIVQLTTLSGGKWTQVTAGRVGDSVLADTAVVSYEVVQYVSGILKSVQPWGITLTALTSATAALSPAVVTGKTRLIPGGFSTNSAGANGGGELWAKTVLTNTTTITATRTNGGDVLTVVGTAVEHR